MSNERRNPGQPGILSRVGEVEVGFDLDFERRYHRLQRIIWVLIAAALLAGLAGVFGRGPLATTMRRSPDGTLRLTYERLARFRTPSAMSIEASGSSLASGELRVRIPRQLLERLRVQRVVPEPTRVEAAAEEATFVFAIEPGAARARATFLQEPGAIGTASGTVVANQTPLPISVFVFP